jgi:hypothetical protein
MILLFPLKSHAIRVSLDEGQKPMAGTFSKDPPNFIPRFIQKQLDNPPILAGENRAEFKSLFYQLEWSDQDGPKTPAEYAIVYQATVLTWNLQRLERMRVALIRHQRPAAVAALLRRTGEHREPEPGSLAFHADNVEAQAYFGSDDAKKKTEDKFIAAGYAPDAVDVEAFQLALPNIAVIDRQVTGAQKQLTTFLKELDRRYANRARHMSKVAMNAISRAQAAE